MRFTIYCASCRCKITLKVEPYPGGPFIPFFCPVCGDKDKDSVRTFNHRNKLIDPDIQSPVTINNINF